MVKSEKPCLLIRSRFIDLTNSPIDQSTIQPINESTNQRINQ